MCYLCYRCVCVCVCDLCVCVTGVCVGGGRHRAVSQGVGVLVVLWESDPSHTGVQHHRGAALAQCAVTGRPGHNGLQSQGPDSAYSAYSAHTDPTDPTDAAKDQVVVQREVVQTICVELQRRTDHTVRRTRDIGT